MKPKDIADSKEGELEKLTTFFKYHQGSICRCDSDDVEPIPIISQESVDKGTVCCPRCDGQMQKRPDGRLWCPKDGLLFTDEMKRKFGIKF